MQSPEVFTVGPGEGNLRLDAFLSRHTGLSRSRIKSAVEEGRCRVDGARCDQPARRLTPGREVAFDPPGSASVLVPEEGDLAVVYRDEYLAVVNKPAGLTVHPCPSCPEGTLVHRLLARFPELATMEGLRPGIVHRLDKDTSGLLVVALTEPARLALAEAFAGRRVNKTYLALTRGVPASAGSCSLPVGRHPALRTRMAVVPENRGGRSALTEWRTLWADPAGEFALLAVAIHTGRTHQIRVHLSHCGHPLWGDALYAPRDARDPAPRQMLHAWKLSFDHPVTRRPLSFVCPPPPDMEETVASLSRRLQRVILTGVPGCGKSSVLRLLKERGLSVWSADAVVAALYGPDGDGWIMLRGRYGERFAPLADDGSRLPVDRAALSRAFGEDPGLRSEVERLVHPLVYASLDRFFADAAKDQAEGGPEVAVAEVPLWHEGGGRLAGPAPVVVAVTCPAEVRRRRLETSRGWSREKTATVESWQWPEEAKIRSADLTVDNSGDEAALSGEVDRLLAELDERRDGDLARLRERLRRIWNAGPD